MMNAEGAHLRRLRTAQDWDARADLMRALAAESRNALARIELAASEIARFAQLPSLASRLDAIHSAVSEIDGLLGRMDGVSRSREGQGDQASRIGPAMARVLGRVAPVLRARGLVLERGRQLEEGSGLVVAMPEALFESVVLGLLGAMAALGEAPVRLRVDLEAEADEIVVVGQLLDAVSFRLREDALQLDLGVELSEWGGRLVVDPSAHRLEARLPRRNLNSSTTAGEKHVC